MSMDEKVPTLPILSTLSLEKLWGYVEALRYAVDREKQRGVGVRALLSYSAVIQEIARRVRAQGRAEQPERWAWTFNDEMWPYEQSEFSSKEEALADAALSIPEYDKHPEDRVYVARQIDVEGRLVKHLDRSDLIGADQLVHETFCEALELPEECEVDAEDISDLDKRLRDAIEAWAIERNPFNSWWVHDLRDKDDEWIYFWDGEGFKPFSQLKEWKEGVDADQG